MTTKTNKQEFSKKLIADVRILLWVVTISGILLAGWCVAEGFLGSLPWISALVGLPWSAHGVICSFYLNMAKSDHKEGGITFETARANGFKQNSVKQYVVTEDDTYYESTNNSPQI